MVPLRMQTGNLGYRPTIDGLPLREVMHHPIKASPLRGKSPGDISDIWILKGVSRPEVGSRLPQGTDRERLVILTSQSSGFIILTRKHLICYANECVESKWK